MATRERNEKTGMAAGAQMDRTPGSISGSIPGSPGAQADGSGSPSGILTRAQAGWSQASGRWSALPPHQRTRLAVGAALVLAVLASTVWFVTRTDWRILYAGMDSDDARSMAQVLTQAQIPFDITADGGTIRVPASEIDKARLATASKGGPRSGRMGFELFDKPNWVGSEFDERVNYQRALEGELEHTIATLSDVEAARVHLVMPHDSLFRDQDRPAKASVVLTLRHGHLADGEDDSIRNLVASAVDGLTPAQVVLVDASGHLPLGPKTGEQVRLGTEEALEAKLIDTLEPVVGSGNVRASVTVDYNPKSLDETDESYDPTQTVALSMQRTEQSTGPQPVAAGVPGTASNAPNSQPKPVYPPQQTQPETAKTESGTYAASHKVLHTVEQPGHLRRITAAILINDRLVHAASGKSPAVWQHLNAAEMQNLTALAQAAVGFDPARGDMVTVENLPFEGNQMQTPISAPQRILQMAEQSPLVLKYGTVLAAIALLILLGIRPALRPPTAKTEAAQLATTKTPTLPGAEPVEMDPERLRAQQLFDQVSDQLKHNPGQSSRLLQSWIHSDG